MRSAHPHLGLAQRRARLAQGAQDLIWPKPDDTLEKLGFGLTVEIVQDAIEAGTFRPNGSFGWDGAFGTHFWVDLEEQLVAVLMIQTSIGHLIHRDFETTVMQAIGG